MTEKTTDSLDEENARLKRELESLQTQREQELAQLKREVDSEKTKVKGHQQATHERSAELEAIKGKMVKLTRQLDEEVQKRDQVLSESQILERKLNDLAKGADLGLSSSTKAADGAEVDERSMRERGSHVSTKLMRVVDQWMRQRDLQQALLRGASINDTAFATLAQTLNDCPSLQTLDLSQNLLTMDSCSDICQLITAAPNLSFVSLAENLFSLRSVGYFMTAIMERQNTKKLAPLDLFDLQANEGLVAAAAAPVPEALLNTVRQTLPQGKRLPPGGTELVAQVMRALWRFLHDTGHPQVKDSSVEEATFQILDQVTLRKMENALTKILLMGAETDDPTSSAQYCPVAANLAFASAVEVEAAAPAATASLGSSIPAEGAQEKPRLAASGVRTKPSAPEPSDKNTPSALQVTSSPNVKATKSADPFADLKSAFEPQREKMKTFNLKQIVTRTGTVLMNMLERLLETTAIDARDVETDQTLLEYACKSGNMGLAKLCYRRGASLSAVTTKGETALNIVTRARRYDLMEFLHTYGVNINSADAEGTTALHTASSIDDADAICRLIEWGADINIKDRRKRTPIHVAAAGGNAAATMLLLEVGADMNAKDDKEYTAVAHAEANNEFALMDRLVQLGGKGHGLQKESLGGKPVAAKSVGQLAVSAGKLKSSSLGRIGKVSVNGMPGPLRPTLVTAK